MELFIGEYFKPLEWEEEGDLQYRLPLPPLENWQSKFMQTFHTQQWPEITFNNSTGHINDGNHKEDIQNAAITHPCCARSDAISVAVKGLHAGPNVLSGTFLPVCLSKQQDPTDTTGEQSHWVTH